MKDTNVVRWCRVTNNVDVGVPQGVLMTNHIGTKNRLGIS